jgi:hypothetical protein
VNAELCKYISDMVLTLDADRFVNIEKRFEYYLFPVPSVAQESQVG